MQDVGSKPDATQVAHFRIALDPEARRLLRNQDVPTEKDARGNLVKMDATKVNTLMKMMTKAVMGETNDSYEFHVFLHRLQKDGESFDEFLANLKELRK